MPAKNIMPGVRYILCKTFLIHGDCGSTQISSTGHSFQSFIEESGREWQLRKKGNIGSEAIRFASADIPNTLA